MNNEARIQDLEAKVLKLQSDLGSLSGEFYKNNFTTSQVFNKDVTFNSRLKVPVYSSAPAVAEVGDIIAVAGKLYICTTAGSVSSPATFTLVGSQT